MGIAIAVGTSNPVKVKAVYTAFSKFCKEIQVYPIQVLTSVPPQPIGIDCVVKGAIERATKALSQVKEAHYGVGIEAGLVQVPYTITGFCDQQFAAIADRNGKVTLGGGPCFEFPPSVTKRVLSEKVEVEVVIEELSGIKRIGELQGAIGWLTRGAIDRHEITVQAVLMALVPRLNALLYEIGSEESLP